MIVAFLSVGESPKYAKLMIQSVRRTMPSVNIYHLTDIDTPEIEGSRTIREVNRFEIAQGSKFHSLTLFKMTLLSRLEGDVLVLDTDVIVQRDVRPVFAFDFDMALTWRTNEIIDTNGVNITKLMPFNTGVMFQRNPKFWDKALEWVSDKDIGWYSDQAAVATVARHFNILRLHCDNFNYTPQSATEDLSNRYVAHYKGNAKQYMDAMINEGGVH